MHFQEPFASEPAVFTNLAGLAGSPGEIMDNQYVNILEVTKDGFAVISSASSGPAAAITAYSWIAIGPRQ